MRDLHDSIITPHSAEKTAGLAKVARERRQAAMPSRGLGDTIAKLTRATGIDTIVKTVFGSGCGCAKRQSALNALLPYSPAAPRTTDAASRP